ncbi:MAG: squalene/phytoene synthase family protein, partial [Vicinamibacterales bacterium]
MARDTSFSYSFLVLPDEQRRAIGVVWDFCRAVDDAVDEAVNKTTAEAQVANWRAEVGRLFGPDLPSTP